MMVLCLFDIMETSREKKLDMTDMTMTRMVANFFFDFNTLSTLKPL
jgi:hypothetical protein